MPNQFIQQLLSYAYSRQVSDIHFDPLTKLYRIRLRQDGLLYFYQEISRDFALRVISTLKLMSQLDITEKRLPQDGHLKQANVDIRLSTCPSLHGEKLVLRLLNSQNTLLKLNQLGMNLHQEKQIEQALAQHQGLILVTGPTGCGKTTTLYAALNHLNQAQKHICTLEDPVEVDIPGITQVSVQTHLDLDFARLLRTLLRQDPDIIMIGEIRDKESAKIACQAAQTGHLVLSTLHSNNALAAISRLLALGVDKHQLASSLKLVIAQRLIRKLCPKCKKPSSDFEHYTCLPTGCPACLHGFSGRLAVFDYLSISPPGFSQQKFVQHQSINHLYQSAILKVKDGETCYSEIQTLHT